MNPPRCDDLDYIHFLIAAQKVFTCTEAARCQPEGHHSPAHDAFTRLLRRQPLDLEALWQEAKPFVDTQRGLLVLDDTTLGKPDAQQMELVTYHWSGKHQRVVRGIALLTLLWTDGRALIPCDFRVYDKPAGGQSKNAHFQAMLQRAKQRGFAPEYVLMDSWYSGLENLKWIRELGWLFLTRLKSNRLVNPDGAGNVPVSRVEVPAQGRVVHLRGFGLVKVFRTVSRNGDVEYLGDERLGDNRAEASGTGGRGLGHRGLPSGVEAMLWGGEGTGSQGFGDGAPFVVGFAGLFTAGGLSFADRGELV